MNNTGSAMHQGGSGRLRRVATGPDLA